MPTVSVIIPIYNSPQIEKTLAALNRQTVDPSQFEVLVVGLDEYSYLPQVDLSDSVAERELPDAHKTAAYRFRHVLGTPPFSPAQNRNRGIEAAKGDILCFTDADCEPTPNWLAQLLARYEHPSTQVVGGGVTFQDESYWAYCDNLSWFAAFLTSSPKGERDHLPTLNFSLRRSVVDSVGGIDESYPLPAGEDTEWTMRMRTHGYRLYFEPRAVVHHAPQRTTLTALWRHGYNFGCYSPKHLLPNQPEAAVSNRSGYQLLPQRPWLLLLASPFLALAATLRVMVQQPISRRLLSAFPGIWLSKLAWCMGAARAMQEAEHRSTAQTIIKAGGQ